MTDVRQERNQLSVYEKHMQILRLFSRLGTDPQTNMEIILDQACHVLEGALAVYHRIDRNRSLLYACTGCNIPEDFHLDFRLDNPAFREVFNMDTPTAIDIPDIEKTVHLKKIPDIRYHGICAYLGYPVLVENRIAGYLGIMDTRIRNFNPDDIHCIRSLADAASLEEKRLFLDNRRMQQFNLKGIAASQEHFAALMESEEKYRLVVENAGDAIFILQHGAIILANPKAEELTGYSRDELADIAFLDLIHPDEKEEIIRKYKKRLKGEKVLSTYATRLNNSQNTILWVQINAIRVIWDKNPATLCFVRDLSMIKALEEKLRRAEKLELIGTMAGGVAHDLNNILSGIVSYPELVLMQMDDHNPVKDLVASIHDAGIKAADMVQDLLTLTRRNVRMDDILNMNRIVEDYFASPAHKRLENSFPHVTFSFDFDTDLLNISGSSAHILKVIMNLVINAAESIRDEGTVNVSTFNKYVDEPVSGYDDIMEGDYVVLKIRDSGKGIPVTDLNRIFEPFYTKKKLGHGSGTGLGLCVVWNTVKDHHGYIDVKSRKGHGTVFELYFPATRKEMEKVETNFSIHDYMGSKESILVIDDIEQQRNIAVSCLKVLGYTPFSVSSGEEAVDFLKTRPMDLIILDMIMEPGIDGLETYKRILRINPDQKAIIASGFSITQRVKETLRSGAGSYIKKPYTIKNLAEAIKKELLIS